MGNRTALTATAQAVEVQETAYAYDDADRLTSVDGVPYSYDDRGNLTGDGAWTYTFDGAGRMVRAESISATMVYTYNGDGLLVAEARDGIETRFTWDQALALPQVLATSHGERDIYGLERIGVLQDGAWYYPQADALGSVRQWTDPAGAVLGLEAYGPYGEALAPLGPPRAAWGYTGEWQDAAALVYLRARWYNAPLGRFTQADWWAGELASPNSRWPHAYALGNPLRYVDPSGHEVPDPETAWELIQLAWDLGSAAGTGLHMAVYGPSEPLKQKLSVQLAMVSSDLGFLAVRGVTGRGPMPYAPEGEGAAVLSGLSSRVSTLTLLNVLLKLGQLEAVLLLSKAKGGADNPLASCAPRHTSRPVGKKMEVSLDGRKRLLRVEYEPDSNSVHIQVGGGKSSYVKIPIKPDLPIEPQIPPVPEKSTFQGSVCATGGVSRGGCAPAQIGARRWLMRAYVAFARRRSLPEMWDLASYMWKEGISLGYYRPGEGMYDSQHVALSWTKWLDNEQWGLTLKSCVWILFERVPLEKVRSRVSREFYEVSRKARARNVLIIEVVDDAPPVDRRAFARAVYLVARCTGGRVYIPRRKLIFDADGYYRLNKDLIESEFSMKFEPA